MSAQLALKKTTGVRVHFIYTMPEIDSDPDFFPDFFRAGSRGMTPTTRSPNADNARGWICCCTGKKNLLALARWVALTGDCGEAKTKCYAPTWGLITS